MSDNKTEKLSEYILGKVSKQKKAVKGEDTFGNQYKDINDMWK
jgi:hypothetical protein